MLKTGPQLSLKDQEIRNKSNVSLVKAWRGLVSAGVALI